MQVNAAIANRPARAEQPFKPLFLPYRLGNIELNNRLVMAPMTRSRAVERNGTFKGGRRSIEKLTSSQPFGYSRSSLPLSPHGVKQGSVLLSAAPVRFTTSRAI